MRRTGLTLVMVFTLALTTTGCGGSSGSETPSARSFSGLWEVFYNIVVDDCGLLEEDEISFEDEHEITESADTIMLDSTQLLSGNYEGSMRSDDSFTATSSIDGDIFGVGINCTLTEDVVYNDLKDDTASTIYNVRIKCDDGTTCDSFTRGTATKVE